MKLVLAEKPSVAQSIAQIIGATNRANGYLEGNNYLVSWCIGHLVETAPPEAYDEKYRKWSYADLPIFPDKWKYLVSESTKKQFYVIQELMNREDVESIVCATDAGREGELIFRLVYHQCRCSKPFERLWISSMEDSAIRKGFAGLRPGNEYDALYQAALCRERADWMVGINATRLFSTLYGQPLNVGRVMTPTLAMVVEREEQIKAFQPEPFYTVQISLGKINAVSERFSEKRKADTLFQNCIGKEAEVIKIDRKEKSEKPPALFDLTSLQREMNRSHGFTAQQTLDYAQSLYEKKLITYPRTDSRYLTSDTAGGLPELVRRLRQEFPVSGTEIPVYPDQVTDEQKVTDHHAILPTQMAAKKEKKELPAGELAVLNQIIGRLYCAVGEVHRYAETTAEMKCADTVFHAKGKIILQEGWKGLERAEKQEDTEFDQNVQIPSLDPGMHLPITGGMVKTGKTTPPKHYTEDTLLQSMESAGAEEMPEDAERKGLGTPATRAATIEKLVKKGFLERKGEKKIRCLIPTSKGTALIKVMPEQICSPALTAEWEEKLKQIEHRTYESERFLQEIREMITALVRTYEAAHDEKGLISGKAKAVGKCPVCGDLVAEREKGFFCQNRCCRFVLWKKDRYFESFGKKITEEIAGGLLDKGNVNVLECRSKTGRKFNAVVSMTVGSEGKPQFTMSFEKGEKE